MGETAKARNKTVIDSAEALALALGEARWTGHGWQALCPAHDDHNPSLSITQKPDGMILFKCQSRGCSQEDIIAALSSRGLWPFTKHSASAVATLEPKIDAPLQPDPRAVELWEKSVSSSGTKVEAYLRARGLTIDPPPSLRFYRHYTFRPGQVAPAIILPAMVAAVQAPDRRLIAVQVTALHPQSDRKFADKNSRRIHGTQGTGAVRLASAGAELGLAEGIEDALGAIQLTQVPCWACLGAARMHRVDIPASIRTVHIFADDDEPGRAAAERTAARHFQDGRRVIVRLPPEGLKDWGDVAKAIAKQRVAA